MANMSRFPPGVRRLRVSLLAAGLAVAGSASADPPVAEQSALPQVTVEARRAALEHQLYQYVTTITHTQSRDEALHRWHSPLCPAVLGLSKDEGEFILTRLSQIARAAGVPLDGEHCQANLAVVFTNDPAAVIKAWGARRSHFGGVHGTPAAFERFRARRGPVRVWYNKDFGSPGAGREPTITDSLELGKSFPNTPTGSSLIGSKMFVKDVLVFSSVAVIVDSREAVGLEIGALADYIAMLALSDTDPEVSLGMTPTILRLFSARAAKEPLPTGLSDWDRAYLKALYSTTLDLITQRSIIAEKMIQDVVP
jgi:hypothetical protein